MGKISMRVGIAILISCVLFAFGCGPKKAVGLKKVFDACALEATLDELGVRDESVRNKDDYLEYVEEKLFEQKDRRRYSKKVWKRLVERTQRAADQDWDRTFAEKKKLCIKHKGFFEKDEIE